MAEEWRRKMRDRKWDMPDAGTTHVSQYAQNNNIVTPSSPHHLPANRDPSAPRLSPSPPVQLPLAHPPPTHVPPVPPAQIPLPPDPGMPHASAQVSPVSAVPTAFASGSEVTTRARRRNPPRRDLEEGERQDTNSVGLRAETPAASPRAGLHRPSVRGVVLRVVFFAWAIWRLGYQIRSHFWSIQPPSPVLQSSGTLLDTISHSYWQYQNPVTNATFSTTSYPIPKTYLERGSAILHEVEKVLQTSDFINITILRNATRHAVVRYDKVGSTWTPFKNALINFNSTWPTSVARLHSDVRDKRIQGDSSSALAYNWVTWLFLPPMMHNHKLAIGLRVLDTARIILDHTRGILEKGVAFHQAVGNWSSDVQEIVGPVKGLYHSTVRNRIEEARQPRDYIGFNASKDKVLSRQLDEIRHVHALVCNATQVADGFQKQNEAAAEDLDRIVRFLAKLIEDCKIGKCQGLEDALQTLIEQVDEVHGGYKHNG
ncbi:MAG: hypothetical protein Q9219_005290 [cf. Caloplaca sp. 3 TL-2023]